MSSYKIIHKGKFDEDGILISYNGGRMQQTREALDFIEAKWRKSCADNPALFNGKLFRLINYRIFNSILEMQFSDTDYKEYVGTRDIDFISKFGKENSANPISVGIVLATLDNKIVLGERTNDVDSEKLKIAVIGGNADPRFDFNNHGRPDLFRAVKREISEEIGINENLISHLKLMGMVFNLSRFKTYIPFQGTIQVKSEQILDFDRNEISRLVIIENSKNSVAEFVSKMRNSLSDITIPTLETYVELYEK